MLTQNFIKIPAQKGHKSIPEASKQSRVVEFLTQQLHALSRTFHYLRTFWILMGGIGPQPFNEFKPIKRQIVPLIPHPALSHQHETCLLLFYRREAGCSTAYFELLLFFIMILVSWRQQEMKQQQALFIYQNAVKITNPLSTNLTV